MIQFMQKPYFEHLNIVNKILRYITIMKDLAIKYFKFPLFVLLGYLYYDYGGDRYDRKSTYYYVFIIGPIIIS